HGLGATGGGMIENRRHRVKSNGSATNACTRSAQTSVRIDDSDKTAYSLGPFQSALFWIVSFLPFVVCQGGVASTCVPYLILRSRSACSPAWPAAAPGILKHREVSRS